MAAGHGNAYLFVFFLSSSPALSGINGMLLPDELEETKNFLEDVENLINYLLLTAYVVACYWFLKQTYSVRGELP
ncbi:MAG: hypothetical protein R3E98_06540 [Gemmatimonadota bacterium]